MRDQCISGISDSGEVAMEYSLQAIYYLIRAYINLLLQLQVTENVTVGGILMSVLLIGGILAGMGFIHIGLFNSYPRNVEGQSDQLGLPDYGGNGPDIRGDNFTMR